MESRLILPSEWRARIAALHYLREQYNRDLKSATPSAKEDLERGITLLRNGVFPEGIDQDEIRLLVTMYKEFSNTPLSTTELLTFNTFFEMNPGKVAGQQVLTSSRDFPLTVSGTRDDVEKAIDKTLEQDPLEVQARELEFDLFALWVI